MEIRHRQVESSLTNYLKYFSVTDLNDINIEAKKSMYQRIVNDYKEGEICLDQLSGLSERIWWSLSEEEKKTKNNKFSNVLMSGMELDFYERGVADDDIAKFFIGYLQDVLRYKVE
jgi:hypothetical protein